MSPIEQILSAPTCERITLTELAQPTGCITEFVLALGDDWRPGHSAGNNLRRAKRVSTKSMFVSFCESVQAASYCARSATRYLFSRRKLNA